MKRQLVGADGSWLLRYQRGGGYDKLHARVNEKLDESG